MRGTLHRVRIIRNRLLIDTLIDAVWFYRSRSVPKTEIQISIGRLDKDLDSTAPSVLSPSIKQPLLSFTRFNIEYEYCQTVL